MRLRNANLDDAAILYKIETACFPANQAASLETLTKRLQAFPQHFWIIEHQEEIVGFINGMVTDNTTIKDEMFKNVDLHNENGQWQSVFGLAVSPEHQNQGYAGILIKHLIASAQKRKLKGIILTCEKHLIPYYLKFGFVNMGLSGSAHGGDTFYDMKIEV